MERPWLSRYDEGVRQHLEYPEVAAYQLLFERIERQPDRIALIFYGRKVSYRELGDLIDRFAAALVRRLRIQPGDRVGIMMPNCPQIVIAIYGTQRAGAIPVMFNPLYVPREIKYQMSDAGVRAMAVLDLFYGKVCEAGVAGPTIVTSVADFLPFPKNLLFRLKSKTPPTAGAVSFMDLLKTERMGFVPPPVNPKEDPCALLYTGGTTGVSKGVMMTHSNFVANLLQMQEWLQRPADGEEVALIVLPIFHSYGYSVGIGLALASGRTSVLVPKFDTTDILKLIHTYKPALFPGIPTIYTALLQAPDLKKYRLDTIELCVSGAAAMPVELMQQFENLAGAKILEGYGMTETSPVTHGNPVQGVRKPGSVGLAYPDTDFRIVDLTTGEDLPPGLEGEIAVRGPQVMKGYWNKPEETAAVLRDGWLFTGDIGRADADGYLYIVDRKKDMIISGGENVYPREIDEVLYQHPAVLEACTVGVTHPYWGESPVAFVVGKPEAVVTEAELLSFCKERLAPHKRPRAVFFVDSLPKSAVGKILRRTLAEEARQGIAQRAAQAAARL